MLNQSTPAVPQQQQQQQRKPIEITIPIRLVDSDEEDADKTVSNLIHSDERILLVSYIERTSVDIL